MKMSSRRLVPVLWRVAHTPAPGTHSHTLLWHTARRGVTGKVGADADEVAELLEASIVRPSRAARAASGEPDPRPRLLTTRREALSLYREVLRYSNLFVWRDEHGRVWRDVIRASARSEFEVARKERDPELINRMIVTGRDAVSRTVEGFLRRRSRIVADEAAAADAGRGGVGSSHGGSGGSVR